MTLILTIFGAILKCIMGTTLCSKLLKLEHKIHILFNNFQWKYTQIKLWKICSTITTIFIGSMYSTQKIASPQKCKCNIIALLDASNKGYSYV